MRSFNRARLPAVAAVSCALLAFSTVAAAKPTLFPKLKSSSVLIVDQSDSTVLYSRRSDVAAPIASITKLMTALVVLDARQPLDEPLAITQDEAALPKSRGSRLSVGTVLTRGDFMHLALMSSENRAAHALGANYPGGVPAIVTAMNAKAAALGMTTAHFVDPTGLSSDNVASPEDLSKLVLAAAQNAHIRDSQAPGRVSQHRQPGQESHLEHHRPEDRLHCRGRQVPGHGGGDRRPRCDHRVAGFGGTADARGRR